MTRFFHKLLQKFFTIEPDPRRLAAATVLGLFIGFSPFLGLQTPLIFVLGYLFRLPISIVFSVTYLINNPFITMVPIILANYFTGYILFNYILPVDICYDNPSWFNWIAQKIQPCVAYFGASKVCFWYFILGGVIFAILLSVPFYIPLRRLYTKLAQKNENYRAK